MHYYRSRLKTSNGQKGNGETATDKRASCETATAKTAAVQSAGLQMNDEIIDGQKIHERYRFKN